MRVLKTNRWGFTLIELLIVVAIIAILAAIAVPNFLEAQTRAKVSRVRSDMRSLALGQDSYFVDWNSYTLADHAPSNGNVEGWKMITTPIAYVSTLPIDPFGDSRYQSKGDTGAVLPATYELGTGKTGIGGAGHLLSSPKIGFPSNTYEMNSSGPDRHENTSGTSNNPGQQYNWADATTKGYPWVHIPADAIQTGSPYADRPSLERTRLPPI